MGIIKIKKQEEVKEEKQERVGKKWLAAGILHEDERQANAHGRHYVYNNGTGKTIISGSAVNYYEESTGKWEEIDNGLEEGEKNYKTKRGVMEAELSKEQEEVKVSKRGKSVSWKYLGQGGEGGKAGKREVSVTNKEAGVNGKSGKAVYKNVEEATDLEYKLQGNNVKENIILREKKSEYRYRFSLQTEGLKLRLSEDNANLELYSEEDGAEQVEFKIPSPYMYDGAGETSEEVYYELTAGDEGEYTFEVVANADWINAEDRVLPVTIDPQIVTEESNVITHQVYERILSTSSSSGSGTGYEAWNERPLNNIRIGRKDGKEYKTVLTIKKSQINKLKAQEASVKMILSPIGELAGNIIVNGILASVDNTKNEDLKVDITSAYKKAIGDFNLELTNSGQKMEYSMTDPAPMRNTSSSG